MVISGQKGLAMVKDQGEVLVFEGAKIKQEVVIFIDTKLLPLVGIDPMKKGSSRVMGNLLEDGK
jgi:hypothetical protein